jgi:hypothetical protein
MGTMARRIVFIVFSSLLVLITFSISYSAAQEAPKPRKFGLIMANQDNNPSKGEITKVPSSDPVFQKQAQDIIRTILEIQGPENSLSRVPINDVIPENHTNNPATGWVEYTDPYWAFTISLPPGWNIQTDPYRDFGFRISSPDIHVDPIGSPLDGAYLSVMVETIHTSPTVVGDYDLYDFDSNIQIQPITVSGTAGQQYVGKDLDGNPFIEWVINSNRSEYIFRFVSAPVNEELLDLGVDILKTISLIGAPQPHPYIAPPISQDLKAFVDPQLLHAFLAGQGKIVAGYGVSPYHTGGNAFALDIVQCAGSPNGQCNQGVVGQFILAPANMKLTYEDDSGVNFFELANDGTKKLCLALGHFEIQLPGFIIGKSIARGAEIGKLTPYPASYPHIHFGLHIIPSTGNYGCGCSPGSGTCTREAIPFSDNPPFNIYPTQGFPLNGTEFPTGPNGEQINYVGTMVTSTSYGMCAAPTITIPDDASSAAPSSTSSCFPDPTCPQSGGVILFLNSNYNCGGLGADVGYVLRSGSGFQNVPSLLNDQLSSVIVPSGWSVMLYENSDRGGGKKCLNASGDADFSNDSFDNGVGLNDKVSSFEVYTTANCTGNVTDTTPPDGDYTSPGAGSTVGRYVHLAAWASDNQSGVKEVHFTAAWGGNWSLVYNDTSSPYEYDWDLCASGVPDGDIELGLDIYDYAGNVFHLHLKHANPHINKSFNCSSSSGNWSVDYWMNKYLAGYVNWQNNESGVYIFRDWGGGGPGDGIPSDQWSARFVRSVYFPGGDYRFHCQHDDGCRIYIDGQLRLDAFWDSSFDGHDWGGNLSTGYHEVKVEYYDNGGDAKLEVWWQGPGFLPRGPNCVTDQWCAEYWGNPNLSGTPAISRNEGDTLSHTWDLNGPDPTFPSDKFSGRFVRSAPFSCGLYRFHVFTDDGVRFWVDNQIKLDQWQSQVAGFDVDVTLANGNHDLKVEYFENGGSAAISLWWEKISDCATILNINFESQHYAKPGQQFDPVVTVGVTSGYLDPARGDHLAYIGGGSNNATLAQPVIYEVDAGGQYTFDVANDVGFRMTAPGTEGSYTSQWQVKINGSLIGPVAGIQLLVDGTKPSISITHPLSGYYTNTSLLTITASPWDSLSGIDQVQFFVGYDNGNGWAWYNLGWDFDGNDGWSKTWDATNVPDQAGIAVYAYAWDRAYNGEGAVEWDITLDRQPPNASINPLAPTQDSTAFILWWNGTDNVAGIDYYDIQSRAGAGAWQDFWTGISSIYSGAWFIGNLGTSYEFRIRGVDYAGNIEQYPASGETSTYVNTCSGDSYEPDNTVSSAIQVSLNNSPNNHTYCPADDYDWIKFWSQSGKRYIIETGNLGNTTDTTLTLYAADGQTILASNDDVQLGTDLRSRIIWLANTNGWLYVQSKAYDGRICGNGVSYNIVVKQTVDVFLPFVKK